MRGLHGSETQRISSAGFKHSDVVVPPAAIRSKEPAGGEYVLVETDGAGKPRFRVGDCAPPLFHLDPVEEVDLAFGNIRDMSQVDPRFPDLCERPIQWIASCAQGSRERWLKRDFHGRKIDSMFR